MTSTIAVWCSTDWAQLVEHRTGITEVVGLNPVGASEFFLGFICNCLRYFITAKISFNSILHLQFTHIILIIYTSQQKGSCKENYTPWHSTVTTLSESNRFRTRKLQINNISPASMLKFSHSKTIGFWQSSHSEMSRGVHDPLKVLTLKLFAIVWK